MYLHVNTDNPNQNRDVVVQFSERCESRNNCKAVWTVWLGTSEVTEFDDQFDAMRFARALAETHQLQAWMLGPEGQGLVRLGN